MKYLLWLSETAALPPQKSLRLLDHFGSGEAVYRATGAQAAQHCQLGADEQKRLDNKDLTHSQAILGDCARRGVRLLGIFDPDYPQRLKNIFDPPIVLYCLGTLPDMTRLPCVAIVGHRKATPYGLAAAEKLGYQLSNAGYVVVSGMAKGIDGAAHKGALKGQGPTVAVFGTAIDQVYPAENTWLFQQILQQGAVLSEYPPGKKGYPGFFPRRNRIISGLCLGTVVVEAGRKSGSLITANLALDQGRDVFAVPGSINADSSAGANDLIKKGAKLISDAWDVVAEYAPIYGMPAEQGAPPAAEPARAKPRQSLRTALTPQAPALPPTGDPLLDAMSDSTHVDALVGATGLPEHQVLAKLTLLELEGRVRQLPGKFFERLS